MSDPDDDLKPAKGLPPEVPRFYEGILDWWREATGQTSDWHLDMTPWQAVRRRILLWLPVAVVVVLAGGGVGFYAFTGWRAQDLARKSQESVMQGEMRYALIQAESARRLRPSDPRVLRSYAKALAANNDRRSLGVWQQLAKAGPLSVEDRVAQAEVAVQFGDDTKFEEALAVLDEADRAAEAMAWRARRALQRGDFTAAERLLREAATAEPTPERQIELGRLLVRINTPDSRAEAVGLVEMLSADPEDSAGLAFGLSSVPAGPATRKLWAERAFENLRSDNTALLPAATVLVADGHRTVDEVTARLHPVFTGARPEVRGRYAQWLLSHRRPDDALIFARSAEARASRGTFMVRAEALTANEDWRGLKQLLDAGSPVSEPVTLFLRARADRGLGRDAAADRHLRLALQAAARRQILPDMLGQVDGTGRTALASETLLDLCGEHTTAEYALRVARWRFSQRGEPRLRQEAFRRALQAAPHAGAVRDLERLEKLLHRQPVDPAETAAALGREPANIDKRLTHALALLAAGASAEARRVLEPCEAIRHQLLPGQKAVVVAVLAATGSLEEARQLARTMPSAHLTDPEYRLVYAFTTTNEPGEFFVDPSDASDVTQGPFAEPLRN